MFWSMKLAQNYEVLHLWFILLPRTLGRSVVCGQNPTYLSWPGLKEKPATKHAWPHLIVSLIVVLQLRFIIPFNGKFSFHILNTFLPPIVLLSALFFDCEFVPCTARHIGIGCYVWPTFQLLPAAYTLIKTVSAPTVCRAQPTLLKRTDKSEIGPAYQFFTDLQI